MLINDSRKIIVLQNPKTGGQFKANQIVGNDSGFIRRHIENFYDDNGINHIVVFPFHITYDEIKNYLAEDFENYDIYTIVRNPYNRVASAINFRMRNLSQLYKDDVFSFEHTLDIMEAHKEILLPLYNTIWFTAQSFWLGDRVNILKYEDANDWKFLDNMLGIKDSKVHIRKDYELSQDIKTRIRNLYYPYDKKIFDLYNL